MKNKKHSCKKYWFILFCWLFSPIFIHNILGIQFNATLLIFGFMVPYWLFVMASIAYERYFFFNYLRTHYPYEYKKLKGLSIGTLKERMEYRNFLDTFYPEDDKEWILIQENLENHMRFVVVSFLSVGCFGLLYLNFLVVN